MTPRNQFLPLAVLPCRLLLLGVALSVAGPTGLAAQAPNPDAVEQLREVLKTQGQTPDERKRELTKRALALHSLPDLRQALALPEWQDEGVDANRAVDIALRSGVIRRFEQAA